MANNWLLNRLREIIEQSKSWPAWVFEQPLTRRDAEKIARGERLRSPAPMASEDVLHRYAAMLLSGGSSRTADAAMMEALAAEVRELRKDKARLIELFRSFAQKINADGHHPTANAIEAICDAARRQGVE